MQSELYISLLQKKLSASLTPEEFSILEDWLSESTDNQLIAKQIEKVWQLSGGFSEAVELDADADFQKLEQRIQTAETMPSGNVVIMQSRRRRWLAIAAAVLILLTTTLVLRNFISSQEEMGLIATEDAPTAQPLELADGSKVWLNDHSSLRFFTKNKGRERRVELTGEAFFEVAKNPQKPFVVHAALGKVTVLGTSFNVKNTKDGQKLEVNVRSGKVRLQPSNAIEHLDLTANQTGVFEKNKNTLVKSATAASNPAAWHTGSLVFKNTPLVEVLSQLTVYYNVTLSLENEAIARCPLTVVFEKMPLDSALETLRTLLGASVVKVSDKEFRLRGGRCD